MEKERIVSAWYFYNEADREAEGMIKGKQRLMFGREIRDGTGADDRGKRQGRSKSPMRRRMMWSDKNGRLDEMVYLWWMVYVWKKR